MRRVSLLLLLAGCGIAGPPADICFDSDGALGRDATTGEVCADMGSPIGYSFAGPNVHLLVDRSGSMQGWRWEAVQSLTPWLPAVGERANLALTLFPGEDGFCDGGDEAVPMTTGGEGAVAVEAALSSARPGGSTPMGRTLQRLAHDPALSCPNRDNVVVLLTDGQESCGGDPEEAIARLATQDPPVEVYVVGFGVGDSDAVVLEELAEAARPSTAAPNFYRADSVDELVYRLQQVTGTCTLQLHEDVDGGALAVGLDGRALSECHAERCEEGFTYEPEHRTVRFEGADCLAILDGACHDFAFDRL